jgi:hypothetical protein
MRGFILQVNEECISGAIDEGLTSIIITCKENRCRLCFSSLDKSGMLSYTWYATDMKTGDGLNIFYMDNIRASEAKEIRDYNKSLEDSLDLYMRLRKELTEEGLI